MPRERILVVDDEASVLEACIRSLAKSGFHVEAVSSASEAFARLKSSSFDLLLTDIKMPDVDGLELLRMARRVHPQLTSIVLTGYGTLNTAMEAIELGVHGFLLKPFTRAELTGSVEGALERARLVRENARLRALLPLFDVSHSLMVEHDVETLYQTILSAARRAGEPTAIWLLVEHQADAGVRILPDVEGHTLATALLAKWPSLVGYFERTRRPLAIRPPQIDGIVIGDQIDQHPDGGEVSLEADALSEQVGTAHCVGIPLMTADQIVGCLVIERQAPFEEGELEWFGILATQGAIAIQNIRLHQQEQQAVRVRDEFLSIAAHELKTPIAVIQAHAELLLDELPKHRDPSEAAPVVAIGRQCANLTRLVEELLLVSRLQFGCLELRLVPCDLGELIADLLAEIQALNPRHQFLLERQADLWMEVDPDHMRHVLENILNNAVRFSPDGGPIRVRLAREGGEVQIAVRDQGIGIPRERQERMFERFYRAHAGQGQGTDGLGLGLYVCLELVARHGGRMWLESEEGIGSTFSISLPLANHAPFASATPS